MGAELDSRVRNYISGRRDKEDCANGSLCRPVSPCQQDIESAFRVDYLPRPP